MSPFRGGVRLLIAHDEPVNRGEPMTPMHWMSRSGAMVLLLNAGLLAGCDHPVEPQQSGEDVLKGLGPGIHPVLVMAGPPSAGGVVQVEVHLRQVGMSAKMASYQGKLGYDTGMLKISRVELPKGVMGAWNETAAGQVRFAGASPEGLSAGPVLVLTFMPRGKVTAGAFTLRMEEVVGAADFADLTPHVAKREHPIFSPNPLE